MKFHTNMFGWEYVWRDFADAFGGEVVTENKAQDADILSLIVPSADKTSTITITPTAYGTAAVTHYAPVSNFVFAIQTEKFIHQFGKAVGLQDIQIGDRDFDSKFLIQSNSEETLKFILDDAKLRQLMIDEEVTDLRMVTDTHSYDQRWIVPAKQHVLMYSRPVLVDKFEHLESICKILHTTAQRLAQASVVCLTVEETDHQNNKGRLRSPLLNLS